MADVLVRMVVPIGHSWQPNEIVFHRWLPLGDEHRIAIERDDVLVQVWFDRSHCRLSDEQLQDIERYVNPSLERVSVDVLVRGVDNELADFIYEDKDRATQGDPESPDERYRRLRQAYLELGKRVLTAVVEACNRLIAYCKYEKGQYWLEQRKIEFNRMRSDFTEFRAEVRCGNGEWVKWLPAVGVMLTLSPMDEARHIGQADWPHLSEFVRGSRRPALIRELLSNADLLATQGFRRTAIIEAVAALEVAVERFGKAPIAGELLGQSANRVDIESLSSQVEHLGLTGTVRYLLPLLFPTDILADDLMQICQRAISIRGNIVHQGQRDVDERETREFLNAVRQVCEIIGRYTAPRPS